MLSVTVLAVILGAGVLVPQYRTFASKSEAIKTVTRGAVMLLLLNRRGDKTRENGSSSMDDAHCD